MVFITLCFELFFDFWPRSAGLVYRGLLGRFDPLWGLLGLEIAPLEPPRRTVFRAGHTYILDVSVRTDRFILFSLWAQVFSGSFLGLTFFKRLFIFPVVEEVLWLSWF